MCARRNIINIRRLKVEVPRWKKVYKKWAKEKIYIDGERSCCWLRHSMNIIFTLISNNANIISRKGLVSFLRRVYNGFDATGNYVGCFPPYSIGVYRGWYIYFGSSVYSCATILYDFSRTLIYSAAAATAAVVTTYFAIIYKSRSFPSWLNILSWFVWHERRTSMRNDCTTLSQKE